jgi:D-alanyl-D-alanine endopeptidase (penicillin-binding protein 7)
VNRRATPLTRLAFALTFSAVFAFAVPSGAVAHAARTQGQSTATTSATPSAAAKKTSQQSSTTRRATASQKTAAEKKTVTKAPAKQATKASYSAKASQARRARIARARAAALARENAIPRFTTDGAGNVVPDVHAAAAILYNPETNEVLWEENSQDKRSIASITKVMTAVVFVESEPDTSRMVTVERADVRNASTTHLRAKETLSLDELFHLLLIASDNAAARVIARTSPWGADGFIERMNEKAKELELSSTTYTDPSGLDPKNVSSAYDMARLISYAGSDERISSVMRLPEYTVHTNRGPIDIKSTNRLLEADDVDVRGGKTGFISKAGYCLAALLEIPAVNRPVAVVVLGARSNTGRFTETRNLLEWLSAKAQDLFAKRQQQEGPQSAPVF